MNKRTTYKVVFNDNSSVEINADGFDNFEYGLSFYVITPTGKQWGFRIPYFNVKYFIDLGATNITWK